MQFFFLAIVSLVLLLNNCSDSSEYGDASDYEKYGAAISGTIKGTVLTSSGSFLSGVSVNYESETTTYSTSTDSSGDFSQTPVAIGTYTLTYTKSGYLTETQYATLENGGETIKVSTLNMLSTSCALTGNISGTITSALSKSTTISGASLKAYRGLWQFSSLKYYLTGPGSSSWSPPVVNSTQSDGSGEYTLSDMPRGYYTILIEKSGYIDSTFWVVSCGNKTGKNKALSSTLPSNSMRIVLSWPETSPVTVVDLDAHITGPDNASGRFHVYYDNQDTFYYWNNSYSSSGIPTSAQSDKVKLDRDEKSSTGAPPGIETITVGNVKSSGTYRYQVHDYTNKEVTNPDNISKSGATVELNYNNGTTTITKTYNAPNDTGSLWEVFTFTTSGGFNEEATMIDQSNASAVQ